MNSKCYKKFNSQQSWFSASNDCLNHRGSLAVFTNIGRPSDNTDLTAWLDTDKTYWIGLVKDWWKNCDGGYIYVVFFLHDNNCINNGCPIETFPTFVPNKIEVKENYDKKIDSVSTYRLLNKQTNLQGHKLFQQVISQHQSSISKYSILRSLVSEVPNVTEQMLLATRISKSRVDWVRLSSWQRRRFHCVRTLLVMSGSIKTFAFQFALMAFFNNSNVEVA